MTVVRPLDIDERDEPEEELVMTVLPTLLDEVKVSDKELSVVIGMELEKVDEADVAKVLELVSITVSLDRADNVELEREVIATFVEAVLDELRAEIVLEESFVVGLEVVCK